MWIPVSPECPRPVSAGPKCPIHWEYFPSICRMIILTYSLIYCGPHIFGHNHTMPCHATWSYHTMTSQSYHAMPCYMILLYYDLTTKSCHAMLHDLTTQPYHTMPYYMILPYYDLTTIPYHANLHDLTIQPYNTMP